MSESREGRQMAHSEYRISTPWEGIVDRLLWTCLFLMPKGLEGLKMFSLENEKTKDYAFFAFLKLKREREDWKGYTQTKTENNWSTIDYACVLFLWKFIYSKRSTGFWYCEKSQGPGRTSGIKNCDQNLVSFLLFKYFSKFINSGKDWWNCYCEKFKGPFLKKKDNLHDNKKIKNKNKIKI